jgi:hypothetical protein
MKNAKQNVNGELSSRGASSHISELVEYELSRVGIRITMSMQFVCEDSALCDARHSKVPLTHWAPFVFADGNVVAE